MLPIHLLPNLTPHSAKFYLVLLAHMDPYRHRVTARIPMPRLTQLSGLSRRACYRAIRQLKDLQLLRVPPHPYHAPATYMLLDPQTAPNPQSSCVPPQTPMGQKHPNKPVSAPRQTPPKSLDIGAIRQCLPPRAAILNTTHRPLHRAPTGTHPAHLQRASLPNALPGELSMEQLEQAIQKAYAILGVKI